MVLENAPANLNSDPNDLFVIKKNIYDECGFNFTNFKVENESEEYNACTFELSGCWKYKKSQCAGIDFFCVFEFPMLSFRLCYEIVK